MEYTNGTVVVIYSYVLCEYILETEDPTADRLMKDPKGGCIEGESEAMGARHTSIGLQNRFFFSRPRAAIGCCYLIRSPTVEADSNKVH